MPYLAFFTKGASPVGLYIGKGFSCTRWEIDKEVQTYCRARGAKKSVEYQWVDSPETAKIITESVGRKFLLNN